MITQDVRPAVPRRWFLGRSRYTARIAVALLLMAVLIFQLATLREGVKFSGGDPALYIHHAKNLVEGRPYADTGYLLNPRYALHPQAYPPGYPLLLAPVYAAFGLNYAAMKIELVLFFVASLAVLALLFRHALPFPYLLALIAAVGFNPYLCDWKNAIMADFPFVFFSLASLLAYQQAQAARSPSRGMLGWSVMAGLGVCGAVLTRMIGVTLIPSLILYDLVRFRRLSQPLMIAVLAGGLLFGAQRLALAPSAGVADGPAAVEAAGYSGIVKENLGQRLGEAVTRLPSMAERYVSFAAGLTWGNTFSDNLKQILFFLSLLPVGVSFGTRLLRRASPVELFAAFYVAALLPWTFIWSRYLIPILPLYFFYLFAGLTQIETWLTPRTRLPKGALLAFTLVLLGASYTSKYTMLERQPIDSPIATAAADEVFAYIEQHTRLDALLVTGHPRMLVLAIDRKIVGPHQASDAELLDYFETIGADYLLTGPHDAVRSAQLEALVKRHPDAFRLVFANDAFRLYRIGRLPAHAPTPADVRSTSPAQ